MSRTTTIRVKKDVQKLLRKVAGAMEISMQDAAEIAIRKIVEENAPWAISPQEKQNKSIENE